MISPDTQKPAEKGIGGFGTDLMPRILVSLFLVPLTVFALVAGGVWFGSLVGLVFGGVYREWDTMTNGAKPGLVGNGLAILLGASAFVYPLGDITASLLVLGVAIVIVAVFGDKSRIWRLVGVCFFGAVIIAILSMRGAGTTGVFAGVFLACTVWMTDTGAFFAGRVFGGAKLSPDISPSKTWSGAMGGLLTGTLCALIVWLFSTSSPWWIGVLLGVVLSVAGQLGDLAESAAKRRFSIKDSGDILPGHGGLMDRLDSLSFAALTLFFVGAAHGGLDKVAHGFLFWP
jgi:phosphatidate cytidylyltransferase